MQEMTLLRLVVVTVLLSLAHTVDHAVRGDFNPAVNPDAYASMAFTLAIYLIAGTGLYLHVRGCVGARAWLLVGVVGLALAVLAHLSPGAEQSLGYIYAAYAVPAAGALAVGVFLALVVALLVTTAYAARAVRRGSDR